MILFSFLIDGYLPNSGGRSLNKVTYGFAAIYRVLLYKKKYLMKSEGMVKNKYNRWGNSFPILGLNG
jgi:hypothetical protein